MAERQFRRFNILDAAVLIAATALAVSALRLSWLYQSAWFTGELTSSLPSILFLLEKVAIFAGFFEPGLVAWSIGLLFLRLRRPRPKWRRIMLQPGAVVGVLTALCVTFGAVKLASLTILASRVRGREIWDEAVFTQVDSAPGWLSWSLWTDWVLSQSSYIGTAILSAWAVLAMSGRGRPEKSWIDRTGRILGLLWIIAAVMAMVADLLSRQDD